VRVPRAGGPGQACEEVPEGLKHHANCLMHVCVCVRVC